MSETVNSILATMQEQAVQRLKEFGFFSNIPIVTERVKDIEAQLNAALSKVGCCVIILTPEANVEMYQDIPYPYFSKIALVAEVVEHPTINQSAQGTGKAAVEIAEHVAITLHHFKPAVGNEYYLDNPSIALVPDENFLVYHVRFGTAGGIKPITQQE